MAAPTRASLRTRRLLLDAAERALVSHGPNVSLDVVAREADVSKGGLLHHFRTRDDLLLAVAEDWMDRFDEAVQRCLDLEDDRPGRWCRAHIRAAFDAEFVSGPWVHAAVQSALLTTPGVLVQAQTRSQRWAEQMASDGLHPQRVLLINRALDGDGANSLFSGAISDADQTLLRDILIELSEQQGPIVRVGGPRTSS